MAVLKGQHLIGKVLGSCVLERVLGYGGSSAVFLAQQQQPERKVAVKVFLPRSNMDRRMRRDFYRRFLREAEAASKLDHPHILPIYSYGEQEGLPYIVMPYMPGGTLSTYMARRGPLSLQEAQWYLEQIASALDYAHEHGCVHCDVKPANILLTGEGHVMLSDFGIARLAHSEVDAEQTQTNLPDPVLGTPDYISPEQALGRPLDGRSDVYSLGVTLFFLLSKRLPFRAESPIALALLHVHEAPPSLALQRGDVTPAVDHVVQIALAKDPEQRFQTAGEFCTAFIEAIIASKKKSLRARYADALSNGGEEPERPSQQVVVVTRPIARTSLIWQAISPRRRLALISMACVLLVGMISIILLATLPRPAPAAPPVRHAARLSPTPTVSDLLASTDSWPASSTYFFDQHQRNYHILNTSSNTVALAPYTGRQYGNFRLSVTMQEIHGPSDGSDYCGVVFRATADQSRYYLFEIAPGEDGQYGFLRYDGNGKWTTISTGSASPLLASPGQGNTVTIEARNTAFTFFVNGKPIGSAVTDSVKKPLLLGQVGLYVENQGTEVAFSHLYIQPLT